MTTHNHSEEHSKPHSADGHFFQSTDLSEVDIDADDLGQSGSSGQSAAEIAAQFANEFLMHRHRGVINCDSYHIIFGNDGWATDHRSRKEMADVW